MTPEDKATWTPEQWAIWTWDEWSRGGSVFSDVVAQAIRGYAEAQAEKKKEGQA